MVERAGVYGRQSRGKAKSIADQLTAGEEVCEENGWQLAETYQDGTSASRYARKGRDDWQRCLADIEAGQLTILVLWESSRGDRTLTTWSAMLDLCRDKGVRIYVISHERLYDPRKPRDWKSLAEDGIASASESDLLSLRVRRGQSSSAKAGRPSHGKTPTGYRRTYDPATGAPVGQVPDEQWAPIVREIIESVARGVPISALERDFNQRGVPTIGGAKKWYRQRFGDIARNVAYIGVRLYNGQQTPGDWEPLVSNETFYAAQRVLDDPSRSTVKPGRQAHLLTYLATAAPCGGPLCATGRHRYRCYDDGCVTVVIAETDALVTDVVVGWLSRPEVHRRLRREGEQHDAEQAAAAAEAEALRQRLTEWRQSAIRGETSPESLAVIEAELSRQIRVLEATAEPVALAPALAQLVEPGADVRARWLAMPVQARRSVLRSIVEIKVDRAAVPGGRYFDPWRLAGSRWIGDTRTWGDEWAA